MERRGARNSEENRKQQQVAFQTSSDATQDSKMALTQENILTFLLDHGGKVKNSDLVGKFKEQMNSSDPTEKKENRDVFKRLVNNIAVVRQVDDVKYVVVKKKYQGLVKGERMSVDPSDLKTACKTDEIHNVDIINNNNCDAHTSGCAEHPGGPSDGMECLTARVLAVKSNDRSGQSGSVFAIVAMKSPSMCDAHPKTAKEHLPKQKEMEVMAERTVKLQATEFQSDGLLYRSTRTKRKEMEVRGSPQFKRCNKITRSSVESKDVFPLDPVEHEWLVMSAKGCWSQIHGLLLQDPQLAKRRNFMSGFTILHWAAKSGNCEMVCTVIDVANQSAGGMDVNARSYDGYTPLHIAAIHGRERVLSLLVCQYGANSNMRDNGGKKPYHYLGHDVSFDTRKILGDPQIRHQDAHCRLGIGQNLQDLSKGFNTFSKLFHPHSVGHKKKYKRRETVHFISKEH